MRQANERAFECATSEPVSLAHSTHGDARWVREMMRRVDATPARRGIPFGALSSKADAFLGSAASDCVLVVVDS